MYILYMTGTATLYLSLTSTHKHSGPQARWKWCVPSRSDTNTQKIITCLCGAAARPLCTAATVRLHLVNLRACILPRPRRGCSRLAPPPSLTGRRRRCRVRCSPRPRRCGRLGLGLPLASPQGTCGAVEDQTDLRRCRWHESPFARVAGEPFQLLRAAHALACAKADHGPSRRLGVHGRAGEDGGDHRHRQPAPLLQVDGLCVFLRRNVQNEARRVLCRGGLGSERLCETVAPEGVEVGRVAVHLEAGTHLHAVRPDGIQRPDNAVQAAQNPQRALQVLHIGSRERRRVDALVSGALESTEGDALRLLVEV
mmetsp:Transcript_19269/g.62860  ORF Transcript_19269/g.62860 Transcript_19269/m.62860 type:complete len:311 (-) Transcript_19269:190-1122(-)